MCSYKVLDEGCQFPPTSLGQGKEQEADAVPDRQLALHVVETLRLKARDTKQLRGIEQLPHILITHLQCSSREKFYYCRHGYETVTKVQIIESNKRINE